MNNITSHLDNKSLRRLFLHLTPLFTFFASLFELEHDVSVGLSVHEKQDPFATPSQQQ